MKYFIASLLFAAMPAKEPRCNEDKEWVHMMTINPQDGGLNWEFESPLWYRNSLGSSDSGNDFVNAEIRDHAGISKIKFVSTLNGVESSKTWNIKEEFEG